LCSNHSLWHQSAVVMNTVINALLALCGAAYRLCLEYDTVRPLASFQPCQLIRWFLFFLC